ncbi:96_t:CDS:2, partial [Cetraspora pellucida]
MNNNSEHVSDIGYLSDNNIQEVESSTSMPRQKAVESSPNKPNAKKNFVNFSNPNRPKKKSYVWLYFEEEDNNDICKIIVIRKRTGNMKGHLRLVHEIFEPDELQSSSGKKHQLNISQMIKNVISHNESKQSEL